MNDIPIEHLYILGTVLIFMIILVVAVWRVRNVDVSKDNLESYQDYIDELRRDEEE